MPGTWGCLLSRTKRHSVNANSQLRTVLSANPGFGLLPPGIRIPPMRPTFWPSYSRKLWVWAPPGSRPCGSSVSFIADMSPQWPGRPLPPGSPPGSPQLPPQGLAACCGSLTPGLAALLPASSSSPVPAPAFPRLNPDPSHPFCSPSCFPGSSKLPATGDLKLGGRSQEPWRGGRTCPAGAAAALEMCSACPSSALRGWPESTSRILPIY